MPNGSKNLSENFGETVEHNSFELCDRFLGQARRQNGSRVRSLLTDQFPFFTADAHSRDS